MQLESRVADKAVWLIKFQSPYGVYGFCNTAPPVFTSNACFTGFQSPYGVYGFCNIVNGNLLPRLQSKNFNLLTEFTAFATSVRRRKTGFQRCYFNLLTEFTAFATNRAIADLIGSGEVYFNLLTEFTAFATYSNKIAAFTALEEISISLRSLRLLQRTGL